jgi:hypothetical protein
MGSKGNRTLAMAKVGSSSISIEEQTDCCKETKRKAGDKWNRTVPASTTGVLIFYLLLLRNEG